MGTFIQGKRKWKTMEKKHGGKVNKYDRFMYQRALIVKPSGRIALSRLAWEDLECPKYIAFEDDENSSDIGIRAAAPEEKGAFAMDIRPDAISSVVHISARQFAKEHNLISGETRAFMAEFDGRYIIINPTDRSKVFVL